MGFVRLGIKQGSKNLNKNPGATSKSYEPED
jgi:hypothetical protein